MSVFIPIPRAGFFFALCLLCVVCVANARPPAFDSGALITPGPRDAMPYVDTSRTDCSNLLAVRLSLMDGSVHPPLADCSTQTFVQSPPLSAFDCTGMTANACAQLYQDNLPHTYMSGGWNASQELWYLPLADDVAGGNLCIDGTRQLVYADKAVAWQCSNTGAQCANDSQCGAGTCDIRDIESNDWVFYTQGGSNCATGESCLNKYLSGEGTMSTSGAGFSHDGGGILSDDPRNPFHRFNRVRLRKCTKDGFMGNTTRPAAADEARPRSEWNGIEYEFDLYFHGFRQWLGAFDKLGSGVNNHREFYGQCQVDAHCAAGDTCVVSVGGDNVRMCRQTKALPSLRAADKVLLIGWSGGSNALAHSGDALVEHLTGGAQPFAPNATVSLAFDAPWKPGLESDTAFALGQRNMYLAAAADIPTQDATLLLPEDADDALEYPDDAHFSNRSFIAGGHSYETNLYRNDVDDESCIAAHGRDTWYCHERNHMLAHHVTAPSFTRMAQRDKSGKDSPGSNHLHSFDICREEQTEEVCYDWVDEEFRQRSFQQSADYFRDFATLAEEGPGAPERGVFAPDNTAHNGIESETEFLVTELVQCRADGTVAQATTLARAMATWLASGNAVGAIEFSEGVDAAQGYVWVNGAACASCPSVPAAQTFVADDDLSEWDMSMCSF